MDRMCSMNTHYQPHGRHSFVLWSGVRTDTRRLRIWFMHLRCTQTRGRLAGCAFFGGSCCALHRNMYKVQNEKTLDKPACLYEKSAECAEGADMLLPSHRQKTYEYVIESMQQIKKALVSNNKKLAKLSHVYGIRGIWQYMLLFLWCS